jgi:hypothetical protein
MRGLRDPYHHVLQRRANVWNGVVRQEFAKHACSQVIDWQAAVLANPHLVVADGVHPDEAGRKELDDLYLKAITAARAGVH